MWGTQPAMQEQDKLGLYHQFIFVCFLRQKWSDPQQHYIGSLQKKNDKAILDIHRV